MAQMQQLGRVFLLLAVAVVLTACEKCFQCGDDKHEKCTNKMSLSLSDLNASTICFDVGSCIKFNGTVIKLPGSHFLFLILPCFRKKTTPFVFLHTLKKYQPIFMKISENS